MRQGLRRVSPTELQRSHRLLSEIRNFYRGQFTQKGWEIVELHYGGSGTLIATGDGKRVQIVVAEQSSGDTLVAINYSAD
jgi:hypothetical protein